MRNLSDLTVGPENAIAMALDNGNTSLGEFSGSQRSGKERKQIDPMILLNGAVIQSDWIDFIWFSHFNLGNIGEPCVVKQGLFRSRQWKVVANEGIPGRRRLVLATLERTQEQREQKTKDKWSRTCKNDQTCNSASDVFRPRKHVFTHTHTLDKKWTIEVIRWELNPLTCN